jgi:hypothetical protein
MGIDKAPPGSAVTSTTEDVPHEADAHSGPGPYDMPINRPPVSTNRPDVDIAHSLIGGAGAPQNPGTPPGEAEAEAEAAPRRGRPPKAEGE